MLLFILFKSDLKLNNYTIFSATNQLDKIKNLKYNGEIFMKVILLSHSPMPEKTVATAAKLCYSPCSIEETKNKLDEKSTASFIKMLAGIGHESPLEHVSFTFGIEGVSRAFLAQITRHRIASFSVQSQRYVKKENFEYVIPPEISKIPEAKEEFLKAMEEDQNHYEKLTEMLAKHYCEELLKSGIDLDTAKKTAEKKAIEDARYVLPNSCFTNIICTFNARSLLNFFSHRCCQRAQWEIREVSTEMLKIVKNIAPNIFAFAGPPCVKGPCKEGKMSCGQSAEMRKFFKNI